MSGNGQIEIPIFEKESRNVEGSFYHVGDFGNANCTINLKDYTIFVYDDNRKDKMKKVVLRAKRNNRE